MTTLIAHLAKQDMGICRFRRGNAGVRLDRVNSRSASSVTYVCGERLESCPVLFGVVHFSHWEIWFLA